MPGHGELTASGDVCPGWATRGQPEIKLGPDRPGGNHGTVEHLDTAKHLDTAALQAWLSATSGSRRLTAARSR